MGESCGGPVDEDAHKHTWGGGGGGGCKAANLLIGCF